MKACSLPAQIYTMNPYEALDKDDTVEACRLWNVAKQVGVNVVREKKEGFEPYG